MARQRPQFPDPRFLRHWIGLYSGCLCGRFGGNRAMKSLGKTGCSRLYQLLPVYRLIRVCRRLTGNTCYKLRHLLQPSRTTRLWTPSRPPSGPRVARCCPTSRPSRHVRPNLRPFRPSPNPPLVPLWHAALLRIRFLKGVACEHRTSSHRPDQTL